MMMLTGWGWIVFILFCVVCAVQLFYYWFFFYRVTRHQDAVPQSTIANPVSIIVCARDEEQNLINNLPAILNQDYPYTHELIVVNDNSYDDTYHLLEQLKKEYKSINAIHLTEEAKFLQGKKFPLSMGIKAAKYELLLLTDADCTPASPNWLGQVQSAFTAEKDIVLGYGAYKKRKGFLNKIIRFETVHTAMQYFGFALAGIPYMGVGRNLAYKKTLFNGVNGFKSHGNIPSGDDDLFINQVATKHNVAVVLHEDTFTYSKPKTTAQDWRKQKQRHMGTGKFYKPAHKWLLGLYSAAQVLVYPLLAVCITLLFHQTLALIIVGAVFLIRYTSMLMVWFGAMNKLKERDLKPYFWYWDVWLMFYFLKFLPAALKKPTKQWK